MMLFINIGNGEVFDGHLIGAHTTWHALAFKYFLGIHRTDGASTTDILGAVGVASFFKLPTLHGASEAFAFGNTGNGDFVA